MLDTPLLRRIRDDVIGDDQVMWGPYGARRVTRGQRFEPLRKQGPFEVSFVQRRARTLRLVAELPRPLASLDAKAVRALERDELVRVENELVRLPA